MNPYWTIGIAVAALLGLAFAVVGFDLRTWNHGRHRGCGGIWWRRTKALDAGAMLRCSECDATRVIGAFIPRLDSWLRGF